MGDQARLFGGVYGGRRVLVTGHTGFKGSWLVQWLLLLGADVTGYALDPPTSPSLFEDLGLSGQVRDIRGDVRDVAHLARTFAVAQPEMVFHLAAQPLVRRSYAEPLLTYETNVMGTVNVLEAARSTGSVGAVIVVTSDKCYENANGGHAHREGDPLGGFDPYSSSKGCAELVTAAYRRSYFGDGGAGRVGSVRAGNVIGGGDWGLDRLVPDCARALAAGKPVVVRNPEAVRPWQHVLEPLSGYLWLASSIRQGRDECDAAFNFGPDGTDPVTVRKVVETMIGAWGEGGWNRADGEVARLHEAAGLRLDCGRAADVLGWTPLYSTTRAIEATAAWYRAYVANPGDALRRTLKDIDEYVEAAEAAAAPWRDVPSRAGWSGARRTMSAC